MFLLDGGESFEVLKRRPGVKCQIVERQLFEVKFNKEDLKEDKSWKAASWSARLSVPASIDRYFEG